MANVTKLFVVRDLSNLGDCVVGVVDASTVDIDTLHERLIEFYVDVLIEEVEVQDFNSFINQFKP